jgi:hypothetical protein
MRDSATRRRSSAAMTILEACGGRTSAPVKGRSTTDFTDFTDGSRRGGPPFGFSSRRPSRPLANPNLRLSWPRRTVQDKEADSLCRCQGDRITRAHRAHSPHPPLPAHPTGHPVRGLLEASLQPFVAPWLGPDGRSRLRVTPTPSQILPFSQSWFSSFPLFSHVEFRISPTSPRSTIRKRIELTEPQRAQRPQR